MTKKRNSEVSTSASLKKQKSPASSNCIRKRKSPAKKWPVVSIQASSDGNRKRKSPVESSPVLPIQASNDDRRKRKSPAESPSVLPIQNQLNNQKSMPEQSAATAEILNTVVKTEMTDQSYQSWEHDEHDLPEVTSLVASFAPGPASRKILRASNAVSPATVMAAPSQYAKVRVGFDRNLEPEKIVKMAELRGKDYFIMKWKGSEIMDIVSTEIAKERCPQVVIEFYERHLVNVHNRDAVDNIE